MSKKPQQGSLGAKMFNLRPGEFIIVPETGDSLVNFEVASGMERQVQNLIHKSAYLDGMTFSTFRCDVILNRQLVRMLGIKRIE